MEIIGASDTIIGHNAIGFDWPALVKMDKNKVLDVSPPLRNRYQGYGCLYLP